MVQLGMIHSCLISQCFQGTSLIGSKANLSCLIKPQELRMLIGLDTSHTTSINQDMNSSSRDSRQQFSDC